MKKMVIVAVSIALFLGVGGFASARIPEPPPLLKNAVFRGDQSPYIEFVRGSFGGPWWIDGWLWTNPGRLIRIQWSAGDARWCNKWSEDPAFRGPARFRGEYWTRLYGPNPNSAHGGWVFGITCGNGTTPNAVARIWVKVLMS